MLNIYKEGFLQKQGKLRIQGYKKRWFVLCGTTLKYYSNQETSESNVLGVVDMRRVVSIAQNKLVKLGFQISTNARTYFLSAKLLQEREEWISILQHATAEAKRLSTCSSSSAVSSGNENKLETNHEYSLVGGATSSQSSTSSSIYDVISNRSSEGETNNTDSPRNYESIYETFDESDNAESPGPIPKTRHLHSEDHFADVSSENENSLENMDDSVSKMSKIMSKMSMESLDSIDSLDLTDDELNSDVVDGDNAVCDPNDVLPKPHREIYASEEIRKLLEADKQPSCNLDLNKLAKDYHLKLDKEADYPAFDALRKFLQVVQ